jgi:hypothetical protein
MIQQYRACQISDYCRFARLWFKVSSLSLHCFELSISLHTRFYILQLEMLSIRLMKAPVIEKATLRKNVAFAKLNDSIHIFKGRVTHIRQVFIYIYTLHRSVL